MKTKTTIHSVVAICATLIPFTSLQAEDALAVRYGGFLPGKTFTLTVTERSSIHTFGTDVTKNAPVPAGIPDFNVGRKVTFTIGTSGQLKGSGFKIVYRTTKDSKNFYSNRPVGFISDGEAASVTKNTSNVPTGCRLEFYNFKFSGFTPVTNTVTYLLD